MPGTQTRRIWTLTAAAALSLCGLASAAPPKPPDPAAEAARLVELVGRMEGRYRPLASFRASFTQTFTSVTFGAEDEARGVLHVVPPHRMRWEYQEPPGQIGIFNQGKWWLVNPQDREVQVKEPGTAQTSPVIDLLSGRSDLLGLFAARWADGVKPAPGHAVVEFVPREVRDDIELLVAEIEVKTGTLARVEVIDPLGNTMTFRLGSPEAEPALPDSAFEVIIPEGYVVTTE